MALRRFALSMDAESAREHFAQYDGAHENRVFWA